MVFFFVLLSTTNSNAFDGNSNRLFNKFSFISIEPKTCDCETLSWENLKFLYLEYKFYTLQINLHKSLSELLRDSFISFENVLNSLVSISPILNDFFTFL